MSIRSYYIRYSNATSSTTIKLALLLLLLLTITACQQKEKINRLCRDWQNIAIQNADNCPLMANALKQRLAGKNSEKLTAIDLPPSDSPVWDACRQATAIMLSRCGDNSEMQELLKQFAVDHETLSERTIQNPDNHINDITNP